IYTRFHLRLYSYLRKNYINLSYLTVLLYILYCTFLCCLVHLITLYLQNNIEIANYTRNNYHIAINLLHYNILHYSHIHLISSFLLHSYSALDTIYLMPVCSFISLSSSFKMSFTVALTAALLNFPLYIS